MLFASLVARRLSAAAMSGFTTVPDTDGLIAI
jgi:hypothetical protein